MSYELYEDLKAIGFVYDLLNERTHDVMWDEHSKAVTLKDSDVHSGIGFFGEGTDTPPPTLVNTRSENQNG